MESLYSLISRNNKVFRRDKTQVFFSLLSIIIVIALYAIFLQKMQLDAIEQITKSTPDMIIMVNEWLVAGLLSMITVTTTLGAFGIMVKDIETKATSDFLTAQISRTKILLGYVFNAFLIGLISSLIAFLCCEAFIVFTGGELLELKEIIKVIVLLIISVCLASVFNLLIILFIQSQNAFSTLSTIVGTVIGFLCGVYVPLGFLPNFAQNLIMYFPISHTTLLLRDVFMQGSISTVFENTSSSQIEEYKLNYGILYEINGHFLTSIESLLFILVTILILIIFSIIIFKKKNN